MCVVSVCMCDLIAIFSMASGASGIGSSSARISSVLRGSVRFPLRSVMPVPAVTAVHSAFWDHDPGQFSYKETSFSCFYMYFQPQLHIKSTSVMHLIIITPEIQDLNFDELTCKAGQWMAIAFPCLIGNCIEKNYNFFHFTFSLVIWVRCLNASNSLISPLLRTVLECTDRVWLMSYILSCCTCQSVTTCTFIILTSTFSFMTSCNSQDTEVKSARVPENTRVGVQDCMWLHKLKLHSVTLLVGNSKVSSG